MCIFLLTESAVVYLFADDCVAIRPRHRDIILPGPCAQLTMQVGDTWFVWLIPFLSFNASVHKFVSETCKLESILLMFGWWNTVPFVTFISLPCCTMKLKNEKGAKAVCWQKVQVFVIFLLHNHNTCFCYDGQLQTHFLLHIHMFCYT